MANHRAQAQFERARWRAVVLFPIWVLQLLLTTSMMGLFAWRLGHTVKHYDERENAGQVPTIELVWEATNVVMSFVAATCTLIEIVKFMTEALTPWTVLFTHVIKLTCASAILALDVVVYTQQKEYQSLIGIGLDVALFITAITLAIYAILTYKRLSAFDDYVRPANVKGYGFNDGEDPDFSYSSRLSVRNSMDKCASGSRRLSIGSVRSVKNEPVVLHNLHPAPSYYSHERDTQFDEYVARRSSLGARSDLERRMSGDYRRDSPPGDISPDSLVVASSVQSHVRGASITREPSYTSDHVLVAVPEEEHEGPDEAVGQNNDKISLLGSSRRNSDEHTMLSQPVLQDVDITEPKWRRE